MTNNYYKINCIYENENDNQNFAVDMTSKNAKNLDIVSVSLFDKYYMNHNFNSYNVTCGVKNNNLLTEIDYNTKLHNLRNTVIVPFYHRHNLLLQHDTPLNNYYDTKYRAMLTPTSTDGLNTVFDFSLKPTNNYRNMELSSAFITKFNNNFSLGIKNDSSINNMKTVKTNITGKLIYDINNLTSVVVKSDNTDICTGLKHKVNDNLTVGANVTVPNYYDGCIQNNMKYGLTFDVC